MERIWRDHSLSIVLSLFGIACVLTAFYFDEGRWFDLWLGLGHGFLTGALIFICSGFFREKNKPED